MKCPREYPAVQIPDTMEVVDMDWEYPSILRVASRQEEKEDKVMQAVPAPYITMLVTVIARWGWMYR